MILIRIISFIALSLYSMCSSSRFLHQNVTKALSHLLGQYDLISDYINHSPVIIFNVYRVLGFYIRMLPRHYLIYWINTILIRIIPIIAL
jgi:hypothetical protein